MVDKDEALKLALEALDKYGFAPCDKEEDWQGFKRAIAAIKEALAQPEQEPVAWQVMVENESLKEFPIKDMAHDWCVHQKLSGFYHAYWIRPLYTTPPQRTWVGLTDEEIAEIEDGYIVDYRIPAGCGWNFAKDIEAKLKEKNGC